MQKSLKEELKFLENHLAEFPDSMLFARLADAYLQLGRIDEATELCEQGVRKHPFYVTGHFILGKCYSRKKLFDQAEKEFKRVLLFDPKYLAAHREYGELMAQVGWQTTCEMTFDEIFRIDPFNQKAREKLAELKQKYFSKQEQPPEFDSDFETEEIEKDVFTETTIAEQETEPSFEESNAPEEDVLTETMVSKERDEEITLADKEEESSEFDISNALTADEPVSEPKEAEEESSSMELLEDIFRDNSIPSYEIDESAFTGESLDKEIREEPQPISPGAEDDEQAPSEVPDGAPSSETPSPFELEHTPEINETDVFALMSEAKIDDLPPESEPTAEQAQPETFPTESPAPSHEDEQKMENYRQKLKKDKIVTPTLGEIYAAQHQYAKAISVYELLMKKDPDNALYKQKIEHLRKKLEEAQDE